MDQENLLGLIRVHVHKGTDLAIRDLRSSDPYVVLRMGSQVMKTRIVKRNQNPVWDEEFYLSIVEERIPVSLEVMDWDRFSADDRMGVASLDLNPFLDAVDMGLDTDAPPDDTTIRVVTPTRNNCLAENSYIKWKNGTVFQKMVLRLTKVKRGEIEMNLRWFYVRNCRGSLGVHVLKGENLAIRDFRSSDPYVILRTRREEVFDKDRFLPDDKMGDAKIDFVPLLEVLRRYSDVDPQENTIIGTVRRRRTNYLAEPSYIELTDTGVVQNMVLELRNVQCGRIMVKLTWTDDLG